MSTITDYTTILSEEEKDIMSIKSTPRIIKYKIYKKNASSIPMLFVAAPTTNEEKFRKAILFVTKKLVPEFKDVPEDKITIKNFTEGITNKLVCVINNLNGFAVNVRTYGGFTEYIIDRGLELNVMDASPSVKVYGTFLNGIIYSYIKGRTLCLGDLIDIKTFNQTAKCIANYHKLKPDITVTPLLFVTLRKWLMNMPIEYVDPKKKPYDINVLKKELVFLENNLKDKSDVVFCHNDLLLKNFIKGEDNVYLIDYEYSGYNYRAFDIANHFNEWCGFDLNWDNYPSEDTQRRFFMEYCKNYYNKDEKDLREEVDKLYEDVKWFELASNYYWGVWALIQEALSSIDFDYVNYGNAKLNRYLSGKKKLLEEETKK